MKLNNVLIGSENPKALSDFYTKVLGAPGWNDGDWFGYGSESGGLLIGPHSAVKGPNPNPARIIIGYETNDVVGEFERICALGATVIAKPYQPGPEDSPDVWLATFADPDGNYFQLATPWGS